VPLVKLADEAPKKCLVVRVTQWVKEVLGHNKMETSYKYMYFDRTNLRQKMEQGTL
jgi:hypothetical protein